MIKDLNKSKSLTYIVSCRKELSTIWSTNLQKFDTKFVTKE